jgi:hypothetical protein
MWCTPSPRDSDPAGCGSLRDSTCAGGVEEAFLRAKLRSSTPLGRRTKEAGRRLPRRARAPARSAGAQRRRAQVNAESGAATALLAPTDGVVSGVGLALLSGGTVAALADAGSNRVVSEARHLPVPARGGAAPAAPTRGRADTRRAQRVLSIDAQCLAMHAALGVVCLACPAPETCTTGHFAGACSWRDEGACRQCSKKPQGALYTSAGGAPASPGAAGEDSCAWVCPAAHFVAAPAEWGWVGEALPDGAAAYGDASALACAPCTAPFCPPGQFRRACAVDADARCEPCAGAPPPVPPHPHTTHPAAPSSRERYAQ